MYQKTHITTSTVSTRFTTAAASLLLYMLFSTGALAQQQDAEIVNTAPNAEKTTMTSDSGSSKVEFVIWLMGSKQISPINEAGESTSVSKKAFINFGMKPNRILSKSFLKKAVNYESTIS